MQYRLRTVLIVLALGPPMLAELWPFVPKAVERYRQWKLDRLIYRLTQTIQVSSEFTTTIKPTSGELTDTPVSTDEIPSQD